MNVENNHGTGMYHLDSYENILVQGVKKGL